MKHALVGIALAAVACKQGSRADCAVVAESLVSIELGNYASREERAAALTGARARCEEARISAGDGACLEKARDRWAAASCVPRLYPDVKAADCGPVMEKVGSALAAQIGSAGGPGNDMLDKLMIGLGRSCVEDRWPAALRACLMTSPLDRADALDACNDAAPKDLQEKIQRRVMDAMKR